MPAQGAALVARPQNRKLYGNLHQLFTLEDYKGSGWSRGHMAPAGNMPTAKAMAQSFSLANMVPQAAKHNGGVWAATVEQATRKYVAHAGGDVYVHTGL